MTLSNLITTHEGNAYQLSAGGTLLSAPINADGSFTYIEADWYLVDFDRIDADEIKRCEEIRDYLQAIRTLSKIGEK